MRTLKWWGQLRVRLLIGLVLVILASAISIEWTLQRTLRRELPQVELQSIAHQTTRLRSALEQVYAQHGTISTKLLEQPPYMPLRIYDASGTLLEASSVMPAAHSADAVARALKNQTSGAIVTSDAAHRFGYQVQPIRYQGNVVGVLEVADELPSVSQFQSAIQHDLINTTILALSSVVAFCVFLGVRFGQIVDEIKQQTTAIVHGNFARRIEVTSNDEIGQIGTSLNQMAESLQRLSQTRTEFLSKVSHELRTPLTIAQGFSSMLRHGPLLPEQERTIGIIDDQLAELTRLVNDLLDLSRRSTSTLDLQVEELDCCSLVRDVLEQHQQVLDAGLTLHGRCPAAGDIRVLADRQRLHQILGNLIGNASRYSRGNIWLELDADAHNVSMCVRDDGCGIAPEHINQIFEPFCQLPHGPRGHAGLGLTIVRELVLAHNGTITVDSTIGSGTCFKVVLPRIVPERDRSTWRSLRAPFWKGHATLDDVPPV